MQFFLMIHMAGFMQFHVMGPWPDLVSCDIARSAIVRSFKRSESGCIPYPVQQPQPAH